MNFHANLKTALGGVIPLGLREGYAALIRDQSQELYVPYDFGGWNERFDNFLHSEGIGFIDGEMGVTVFEELTIKAGVENLHVPLEGRNRD